MRQFSLLALGIVAASAAFHAFAQPIIPYAATLAPWQITPGTVKLTGLATPNGLPSMAWFEWGTNNSFGQFTTPVAVGNGSGVVPVIAPISSLTLGRAYSCRLVVSNALAVAHGVEQRFTAGLKVAQWGGGVVYPPAPLTNAVGIASGGAHYLAVRNDGTIAAWGSDTYGESDVPLSLSNVVAVSAGSRHSVALKADGTVSAWGVSSVVGETAVPSGLSNVLAIATGVGHNLALVSDGTVVAWGENEFSQATVPAGLSNVVAVACGSYHSLALKNDGTVIGWGENLYNDTTLPTIVSNVVAVSAGFEHSMVLESDGTVVAWGGVNGDFYDTWVLAGPGNAVAIAAGDDASLILGDDGSLTAWRTTLLPGLSNAAAISAGWLALAPNVAPQAISQSVSGIPNADLPISLLVSDINGDPLSVRITALPAAGTLYQYTNGVRGSAIISTGTLVSDAAFRVIFAPATNGFGNPYANFNFIANDGALDSPEATITVQLFGSPYAFTAPATLIGPTSATLNGAATLQGLASVAWFEWGTSRQYGTASSPVSLGGGAGMVRLNASVTNLSLGANYHFRLVVSNSAAVTYGPEQLFTTGRNVTDLQTTVPPGVSNVVGIARGYDHLVALRNDGTAIAWGANGNSQTNVPANATNLIQVAAGNAFSLALRANGQITGWGLAANGQLSIPGGSFVEVAAGAYHGLGLRSDGTVTGWGAIGNNLNLGQVTPPANLSNVVAISAGVYHSLALKNDGTVVAWGNGYYGQTSVPGDLSNVVAIAAGSYHSLALKADGTMVTWGQWNSQNIPLPTGMTNIVSIGAGYVYNLALTSDGNVGGGGITVPAGLSNAVAIAAGNASDALAIANLPPQASARSASSIPNRDIIFILLASDLNADPLSFRITALPAPGTLYQSDSGGGRGAMITSADTVVTDPAGRVIYAPALNGFGTAYATFTYVANDGQVDSAPATATVNISAIAYASTQAPASIGPTNATLNGMAVAGGIPALAWFEWGTNSNFGQTTPATDVGTGFGVMPVAVSLNGLSLGGVYHFHLVVSNAAGIAYGGEQVFTTASPLRAWGYNSFGQAVAPAALSNAVAVACGAEHNLALLNDGSVAAWGRNDSGQATVPASASNVVAVAAGDAFSLALQSGGNVIAWGTNNSGQTAVPAGVSNVIAVAAGANHALALRSDGTVVAWGLNTLSQTNVPLGLTNVVAIAAGAAHSLALKSDSTVVVWGNSSAAVVTNVVAIAAAGRHSLALKSNGTVVDWGISTSYGDTLTPSSLANVIAIAAGTNHNIALRRDGSVAFWGRNDFGQASPIPGLSNVVAVAAGNFHDLALAPAVPLTFAFTLAPVAIGQSSATLEGMATPGGLPSTAWFQWGTNLNYGQTTAPVDVGSGSSVIFISTNISSLLPFSTYHCRLAVSNASGIVYGRDQAFTTGGRITAFGSNVSGQTNVPPTLHDVVAISGGLSHCLALQNDGTVVAWGLNNYGQGTVPASVSNAVAIAAGANHNLVLKSDGTVVAWGLGVYGQTNVPPGLSNVIAIVGGGAHSLALKADGTVVAWGSNAGGQSAVPPGLSNCVAIAASTNYSLALKNDGTVVFWGSNVPPPGLSNGSSVSPAAGVASLISMAAGYGHGLGLQANSLVSAWGDNYFGQTNIPASVSNAMALSAGQYHSAAIKTNGTVVAWGSFTTGFALNVPTNLTNTVAIASGANHILALTPGPTPSLVLTLAPSAQRATSASLNGVAIAVGSASPVYAWFEWGTNGTFGSTTPKVQLSNFSSPSPLSASLSGLSPGGIYSCRVVMSNLTGVARGAEQKFTTGLRVRGLGDNAWGEISAPPGLGNAVVVSAGSQFSLALRNDGSVLAWGNNSFGQTNVPAGLTNVVAVAGGGMHSLALNSDGTVTAWGYRTNVPAGLGNVVAVSAGPENMYFGGNNLARRADGTILAWGFNTFGLTNPPANLGFVAAIAAGYEHNLVLKADGTVVAWGNNANGQTNVPNGLVNVTAIAAGAAHCLALKGDGTVVAWGDNSNAQTNVPSGLTNVIAIAAGYNCSLALKKDGSIVGWGDNNSGQLGFSALGTLSTTAALAGGDNHILLIAPNRPPIAVTAAPSSPANRDLVITLTGTDSDQDHLSLRVTTLPAQGLLYQYAGGGRGALITNANAALSDAFFGYNSSFGRLIFVPAANAYGPSYATFQFVADDSYSISDPGVASISISPPVSPLITSSGQTTNSTFQVVAQGDSNTTYCVWASTDLTTWDYLGPAAQTSPGQFLYADSTASHFPQRFYRLSTGCVSPAAQFTGNTRSAHGFALTFSGSAGAAYRIWASSDLVNWQPLGTASEIAPGVFRYLDPAAANLPQRFYRAGTP